MKVIQIETPKYTELREELDDNEIKVVESAIAKTFGFHSRKQADNYFGLAYTSSSAFAGLFVCNVDHDFEAGSVQGFCVSNDGRILMYTHDRDEKETWYQIGNMEREK